MQISQAKAAVLGAEAAAISQSGRYSSASGSRISIAAAVTAAKESTRAYPPDALPHVEISAQYETQIEVTNESTLAAGKRLLEDGFNPVALNFASAKNPGGGFLSGARAQEESLCRASALHACLNGHKYYDYHRKLGGGFYSDFMIYSPSVPVFRDEYENLLDEPWPLSFITSAAPNAKAIGESIPRNSILAAFALRIRKVLMIAVEHQHDVIVLGAWGCGAFGNDAQYVAPIFARQLDGEFCGVFQHVVFAVLDWSNEKHFISPFEKEFM